MRGLRRGGIADHRNNGYGERGNADRYRSGLRFRRVRRRYRFTITNSTERYPKKYRFTLVNRIQDKAVDIYECVLEANELDLRDAQEYRQRQKLQAKALTYCKELLFFIELSQEMGFISMSSCEYWSKLALEVKYMTTAWKKRDKTRA